MDDISKLQKMIDECNDIVFFWWGWCFNRKWPKRF